VFVVLALTVGRPLARLLLTRFSLACALVVGFGIIASATLTPLNGHFNFAAIGRTCDFSRMGLAPLDDLLQIDDTSLNIVMFIPFGVAIGLLHGSRRKAMLIVAAIVLPFAIETTQLLVPALERGCQSADVFDNLTGLAVGLALGMLVRWVTAATAVDGSESAT
jgi:glycopeptide antibiotics resistance protein